MFGILYTPTMARCQSVDFARDVLPVLKARCFSCHGPEKQRGGLRLDRQAEALEGGDSGKVLLPRNSAKSLLWQRVASKEKSRRMPPSGEPLSEKQLTLIKSWIDGGVDWTGGDVVERDAKKEHWAFQPVVRPKLPEVAGKDWIKNPIDAFILARLEKEKLKPQREAGRRTLLRRLKFDLLGLPPTPEEVDAFVKDADPRAYEKWVDRFLASPHFGERWARHWLDVVRFAESDGFEMNRHRPNAWHYRDYVIRAFNEDKPYDRFVVEQLAGDAFGEGSATGFLVGGAVDLVKSPDIALTLQQRADELHDMVSTTGATFLGLTVGCARCHNHKFDPISHVDYHAFKAMFAGVQHGERPLRPADDGDRGKRIAALTKKIADVSRSLEGFDAPASVGVSLFIDDDRPPSTNAAQPSVTQLAPRIGMQPHKPGVGRGEFQDPGDVDRLPNLGKGYSYWNKVANKDVFAWNPRTEGTFRVWLSWGCGWKTHAADARYFLDLDGDLATRDDQKEIARVDQRKFADGSGEMPGAPLWSGFYNAGVHALKATSRIVLRGGSGDEYVSADVLLLQDPGAEEGDRLPLPRLRGPVDRRKNVERFTPIKAKALRMTILDTTQLEPCIDELEVYSAGVDSVNIALAKHGTKAFASSSLPGYAIHKLEHIHDGRYGNSWSWISNERGKGWVTLEFPESVVLDRIVWSRDREEGGRYNDRTANKYVFEAEVVPGKWQVVASSEDRLPMGSKAPLVVWAKSGAEREKAQTLVAQKRTLEAELKRVSAGPVAYAGKLTAAEPTFRLFRGDPMEKREPIAPGGLANVGPTLALAMDAPEQDRRLALARWIVDPANPLTARVIVNRMWHYHFGTGIVATPSDLGLMGARPTHPELLDWLASELVANKWSLKHIHRLIVTSAAYRQGSAIHADGVAKDAQARLLWRFPSRRLEAEPLRDAILSVSGKLNLKAGGPGFDLFEPNTNYVKVYTPRKDFGPEEWRRLIYQSKPRMQLDDTFGAFDCPDGGQITPRRNRSITALQALNLLNSPFLMQQSTFFAERLRKEAGDSTDGQARLGFRLAFGRDAAKEEVNAAAELIRQHGLVAFCRVLFNANEFVFVD